MAGIMGVPIGTFGPRGADFSPYLQMQEMRQRERERLRQEALARAELARQQETSFLNREAQRLIQERQERLTRDQMAQSQARWQSETDYGRAQDQERAQWARQQAERQQAEAQAARAQQQANQERQFSMADRDFEARQALLAEARQREQAKEAEQRARLQVRGRARAIIAERVGQIRRSLGEMTGLFESLSGAPLSDVTPDRIRDMMLAETQQADLSPEDREEVQAAIAEWYQDALRAEDASTARDFNRERLAAQRSQQEAALEELRATREGREGAAAAEAERKRAADRDRALAQRLALIDRKLARAEKRREEVFGMLEYYRGKEGSDEQVARLEKQLEEIAAEMAKLEAEEERVLGGAGRGVNSQWGDTLSE